MRILELENEKKQLEDQLQQAKDCEIENQWKKVYKLVIDDLEDVNRLRAIICAIEEKKDRGFVSFK
jgi:hypothetical protein